MSKSDLITIIVASIPFIITAILIFVMFMLCQKEYRERIKFWRTHNRQQEKEHKALEIIKNKKVNVRAFLKSCYYKDIDTQLNVYNSQCNDKEIMESKELTREEYDFLKEILK